MIESKRNNGSPGASRKPSYDQTVANPGYGAIQSKSTAMDKVHESGKYEVEPDAYFEKNSLGTTQEPLSNKLKKKGDQSSKNACPIPEKIVDHESEKEDSSGSEEEDNFLLKQAEEEESENKSVITDCSSSSASDIDAVNLFEIKIDVGSDDEFSDISSEEIIQLQKERAEEEEDEEFDNPYEWRKFKFREAEKLYKDNFKYMPLDSKVKYLNLYTAARLILYEFMFYAFQRLPIVQLTVPLVIEIYVFILVLEGHTRYDCFESKWAAARYIL